MDLPDSKKQKTVVLLSGGLDSATTLAMAKAEGHELYAISFDYHQRHLRELESARMVASALKVRRHLIVDINMRGIGGSALTDDIAVPKNSPLDIDSIPVTYVPARNTVFLSFGLAWAEVLGAENIYIGANAVDYSGYPDCRPQYIEAFEQMANLATKASVEGRMRFYIRAPLLRMTKAEIIKKGTELGLDYGLTWSCYDPQPVADNESSDIISDEGSVEELSIMRRGYKPCCKCDSCRLRQKGFQDAGIRDPLL